MLDVLSQRWFYACKTMSFTLSPMLAGVQPRERAVDQIVLDSRSNRTRKPMSRRPLLIPGTVEFVFNIPFFAEIYESICFLNAGELIFLHQHI